MNKRPSLASRLESNDAYAYAYAYAYAGRYNVNRNYVRNGLNRYTSAE